MSQRRRASIIITSYNYGRFLRQAIDSALSQSYPLTEVIVVDDGSSDESLEIIARYNDRVTSIMKTNEGQASAFNVGYKLSHGDIIIFLDSDDALLPTAVETAVRGFDRAEVVKVHWPLWAIDEAGAMSGQVVPAFPLGDGDLRSARISEGVQEHDWPPTSGNAWTRSFLDAVLPMPEAEYVTCPDLYLGALAGAVGLVKKVSQPQSLYRVHGNNNWNKITRTEELRRLDHCLTALENQLRATGANPDSERWRARSWLHRLFRAAEEIATYVPLGSSFLMIDGNELDPDVGSGRRRIPFLERDGAYWGAPEDDDTAISELERLRNAGANYAVVAWPAFWWLEHYAGLRDHLHSHYPCLLENERLIVYDLGDT